MGCTFSNHFSLQAYVEFHQKNWIQLKIRGSLAQVVMCMPKVVCLLNQGPSNVHFAAHV
jgi:hypothetical protein